MRKLLILGTAMALLGGVALAQADTAPAPAAPAATPHLRPAQAPVGPAVRKAAPAGTAVPRPGMPGWHHWGWGSMPWQKDRPPGPRMGMGGPTPPPPSKGAHVILEHGRFGGRIDVKCADNEFDAGLRRRGQIADVAASDDVPSPAGGMMARPEASGDAEPETPAPETPSRRLRLRRSKRKRRGAGSSPAPHSQIVALERNRDFIDLPRNAYCTRYAFIIGFCQSMLGLDGEP